METIVCLIVISIISLFAATVVRSSHHGSLVKPDDLLSKLERLPHPPTKEM